MITEVEGCLIKNSLKGDYDIIVHGVNCFNLQKLGLAPQMAKAFGCDKYTLESKKFKGDYDKLGRIDYNRELIWGGIVLNNYREDAKELWVVNAYTQYQPGPNADITALRLCLKKINHLFKGKHIGLPLICAGIGGLTWADVKQVIIEELKDMKITIVHYKSN